MAVPALLPPKGAPIPLESVGVWADNGSSAQEALADSFEAMTLYEDALIQYDELEASFFQVSKGP